MIRKKNGIKFRKEVIKVSLFLDYLIIYVENPKELRKKSLVLINDYSKFVGYKVNVENQSVFCMPAVNK